MNSRKLAVAAALLLGVASAHAAITCYVRQGGTVQFTGYDMTSTTPNDASLAVVIGCDRDGGPASVSIEVALGPSAVTGSAGTRRMRHLSGSSDQLTYNLYRDAGRTAVWGFTSGVDTRVQTLANVPNKSSASTTFTVYGRIDALQDVALGGYADTVQITVNP